MNDDYPGTHEAALFGSVCPVHFPLQTIIMASKDGSSVGYMEMDHSTMFKGEGEKLECSNNRMANLRYELMLDRMVELDWKLLYRGPRLHG